MAKKGTNADINEKLLEDVRSIYNSVEQDVLERVAKRVKKGVTESGWTEEKLKDTQALNHEIEKAMASANKLAKTKIAQGIKAAYKDGYAKQGEAPTTHESIMSELDIPIALQTQILATNNLLDNASFQILRNADDAYRQVMSQSTTGLLAGSDTRIQASQKMLNNFAAKGITTFVDKSGRNWSLSAYSEMCARTVSAHAALQGHVDNATELGEDLMKVSSIGTTCPICMRWQGVVISISGKTEGYHTLDEAKSAGLFHPNCKHTLVLYDEELDGPGQKELNDPQTTPQSQTRYNYLMQQRSNERHIRYWKQRASLAITPEEQARCNDKIKYWQNTQILHCTKHNLRRMYAREGNMYGHANGKLGPVIGATKAEMVGFYKDVIGEPGDEVYAFFHAKDYYGAKTVTVDKWLKSEITDLSQIDVELAAMKDASNKAFTPTTMYHKYIGDNPKQDWLDLGGESGTGAKYGKWISDQCKEIGKGYKIKPKYKDVVVQIEDADKGLSATEMYKKYFGFKPTDVFKAQNGGQTDKAAYGKWLTQQIKDLKAGKITKTVPFDTPDPPFSNTSVNQNNVVINKAKQAQANASSTYKPVFKDIDYSNIEDKTKKALDDALKWADGAVDGLKVSDMGIKKIQYADGAIESAMEAQKMGAVSKGDTIYICKKYEGQLDDEFMVHEVSHFIVDKKLKATGIDPTDSEGLEDLLDDIKKKAQALDTTGSLTFSTGASLKVVSKYSYDSYLKDEMIEPYVEAITQLYKETKPDFKFKNPLTFIDDDKAEQIHEVVMKEWKDFFKVKDSAVQKHQVFDATWDKNYATLLKYYDSATSNAYSASKMVKQQWAELEQAASMPLSPIAKSATLNVSAVKYAAAKENDIIKTFKKLQNPGKDTISFIQSLEAIEHDPTALKYQKSQANIKAQMYKLYSITGPLEDSYMDVFLKMVHEDNNKFYEEFVLKNNLEAVVDTSVKPQQAAKKQAKTAPAGKMQQPSVATNTVTIRGFDTDGVSRVTTGHEVRLNEGHLVNRSAMYQDLDFKDLDSLAQSAKGNTLFANGRRDILGRDSSGRNHHMGHDVQLKAGLTPQEQALGKDFAVLYNDYINTIKCNDINQAALYGYENASPSMQRKMDAIDRCIKSCELAEDVKVNRFMSDEVFDAVFGDFASITKGTVVENKPYMSTTISGHSTFEKRNYMVSMQLDKGTHALPTLNYEEGEVLLGRNGKLEVVDVIDHKRNPLTLTHPDGTTYQYTGKEVVTRYIEEAKAKNYEVPTPEKIDAMLTPNKDLRGVDHGTPEFLNHVGSESKAFIKKLAPNERKAMDRYTGNYYTAMNNVGRRDDRSDTDITRYAIDLANAMSKASTEDPLVLRRGLNASDLAHMLGFNGDVNEMKAHIADINAGDIAAEDKGFLSMSPYGQGGFYKDADIRVYCPAGTKAAYVDKISTHRGERETVLQCGSVYRVLKYKFDQKTGHHTCYLELLGTD